MAGQYGYNAVFLCAAQTPIPLHSRPNKKGQPSSPALRPHLPDPLRASFCASGDLSRQTERPAVVAVPKATSAVSAAVSLVSLQAASATHSTSSLMRRPRFTDDPHGPNMKATDASADSVSSASGTTMSSSDPLSAPADSCHLPQRPFIHRNGRTFLSDTTLPYPLPVDLAEVHRQSLRTLLMIQIFGAPLCSLPLTAHPPRRVLEIGCGSGFWSVMCHRYFQSRSHGDISFTGIDITPLAHTGASTKAGAVPLDRDMCWKFVRHDLRQLPWPLPSEEFDLVMVKDMSLATTNTQHQAFLDEYIRLLRPGGTLEIWESDHLIRMLRPHVLGLTRPGDDEEQKAASGLGTYLMSVNTPLSPPLNPFLVDYNNWLTQALEARKLSAVPCALVEPALLQESETLEDVRSRRFAVPLGEIRWEQEGIDGVITHHGRLNTAVKGKEMMSAKAEPKPLKASQLALRRTALLTVVQQIQSLEPILREVSGKSQDEWDIWMGKMTSDLMGESSGTNWGECLEIGAWWAKKKKKIAPQDLLGV